MPRFGEKFSYELSWEEEMGLKTVGEPALPVDAPASGPRSPLDQACEALEFAQGALIDAIGLEDGLDGLTGARVIHMIRAALVANGRQVHPLPTDETYHPFDYDAPIRQLIETWREEARQECIDRDPGWPGAEAKLLSCADDLEALLTGEAMSEWQPIDTAPKDGREILVRCRNRAGLPGTVVAHFCSFVEDHPPIDAAFYFWNGGQFTPATQPTHWMPLPDPPALLSVSEQGKKEKNEED